MESYIQKVVMNNYIKKFMRDEEGLTIVEYAVGAALINVAVAVAVAFTALGDQIEVVIDGLTTTIGGTP